jgi:hypothetical protein
MVLSGAFAGAAVDNRDVGGVRAYQSATAVFSRAIATSRDRAALTHKAIPRLVFLGTEVLFHEQL